MNWGYKILLVYIVFIAGILVMVFKSSSEKTDLVTADYYGEELKYQEKIDREKNTNALSSIVQYYLKDQQLIISFPKDFKGKKINGQITLYCPSDKNKDVTHKFSIQDIPFALTIPKANTGLFELQINWMVDGVNYYYGKKIFI